MSEKKEKYTAVVLAAGKGTRHGWDLNAVPNLKLGER